jgi:hypothetical protein
MALKASIPASMVTLFVADLQEIWLPQFVSYYLNSDGGRSQMIRKAETTSGSSH